MKRTLEALAELTGHARAEIPRALRRWRWRRRYCDEAMAAFTGRPPKAPLAGVRMAQIQDVIQPGQGHSRIGVAPDAATPGIRGCD